MCGINGYIQLNKRNRSSEEMREIVHGMNERIAHRGPDCEGIFADAYCTLGMRRLSIIDLGSGSQPIWNEDHTLMIVFNGEIYNFRELQKELTSKGHHFSTKSDTEVILHGYEEWGLDVPCHLEGMFVFCIYDTFQQKWILARDRIGEKPLYYYQDDFFLFGSELKSLMYTGLIDKKLDMEALSVYFRLTYIPSPLTIFEKVKKLMPATIMVVFSDGRVESSQYWTPAAILGKDMIEDYGEAKRLLRDALFSSVDSRMNSDVPLGAFLSGGFDSSIITGIMSELSNEPVHTFTIGFDEKQYDESQLAQLVSDRHHTVHKVLKLDWDEVFGDLDKVLSNIDEPFADSSLIATHAVSKLAKEHVTVVLTGDAGDELFAGYNKYLGDYYGNRYKKLSGFIRHGLIEPAISMLPKDGELARKAGKVIGSARMEPVERVIYLMSLGFKENEACQLLISDRLDCLEFVKDQYAAMADADAQTRNQFVDLCTVLEGDMLTKVDRASMLTSLEARVPMLDYHVVELAYRMPTSFKINNKERKIILKDTFQDLLPEKLFKAPKRGFGVPIEQCLRGALKEQLYSYADREFLEAQGIFRADYIKERIDAHVAGRENRYSELWAFFVFQNWWERIQ